MMCTFVCLFIPNYPKHHVKFSVCYFNFLVNRNQQFKCKDHGSMNPFAGLTGITSLLVAKNGTSEYAPKIGK